MEHDIEYYMANQDAFDALTEEQVMALSRGEAIPPANGDTTDSSVESGESPATAPTAEIKEPDAKVEEPKLLAKDGVHTIPFQRLKDAETKAAEWEAVAKSQESLIESLKQAKIADAKTGGTEVQEAVLAEYAGEFPEVVNDLKPYMQAMIDAGVKAKMSELESRLNSAIEPMQKATAEDAADAHFSAIKSVVTDFDALVESNAVGEWIMTQPKFMQASMQDVLDKGTAADVIDLFTAYKATLGTQKDVSATPSKEDLKTQAAAVIAKAKASTPVSLTDIPSGTKPEINSIAAEASMSASQLLAKFQGMTSEQILQHASRVV